MGKQQLKSWRAAAAAQQPGFSWFPPPPVETGALHAQPKIDRNCLCLQRGTCCCGDWAVAAGSVCEAGSVPRPIPARVTCVGIPWWSGAGVLGCSGSGHPLPPSHPPHHVNGPCFVAAPREGQGELPPCCCCCWWLGPSSDPAARANREQNCVGRGARWGSVGCARCITWLRCSFGLSIAS